MVELFESKEHCGTKIKYMMLYPAKLRVIAAGKLWHFATLEEAWNWMDYWNKVGGRGANNSKNRHQDARQEQRHPPSPCGQRSHGPPTNM